MAQRPIPLLFALGLLVGIGGALYFRLGDAPPAPEQAPPVEVPIPAPVAPPPAPPFDPADPTAREDAIRATRLPSEVRYPIEAQYRGTELSAVPHELIAAYDEAPGRRRRFILAVPPDTQRDALAQLVQDLRAHHLDADALRIQIFDSKAAATHPAQAGVSADPHLVASYSRDGARATYELQGKPAPLSK
jgi:hypothetical protein